MHLTVKTKIVATKKQQKVLTETMLLFNDACNYISEYAHRTGIFKRNKLHRLIYADVRKRFCLGSQAVVRAISKVVDAYNSGKRRHRKRFRQFNPKGSVIYDDRNLTLKTITSVSLWTTKGRLLVDLLIGHKQRFLLENFPRCGEVDLLYVRGSFYLHFVVDVPDEKPLKPIGFLGVDLGIVNLATTSEGEAYSGEAVDRKRCNINRRKRALQKRNGKKAKYSLKKLSGKERRFKRNTNHVIAKELVARAQALRVGIAIEDLSGFRATVSHQQ